MSIRKFLDMANSSQPSSPQLRVAEYVLLHDKSPDDLSKKVTEHLVNGYVLNGPVFEFNGELCQQVLGTEMIIPPEGPGEQPQRAAMFKKEQPRILPVTILPRHQ